MKCYAKEQFYSNIDEHLTKLYAENKPSYWKVLRHVLKTSGTRNCIPPLKENINDEKPSIFSDAEIADKLNQYFESISTLQDQYAQLPEFKERTDETFDMICITKNEISDIIKSLQTNKASGPDKISHKLLKSIAITISEPLCELFNLSLTTSIFPTEWKQAIVMPLFKKGDHTIVSNYRPISLISCVGKVFERVVYKHLYNYFHVNKIPSRFSSWSINCTSINRAIPSYLYIIR